MVCAPPVCLNEGRCDEIDQPVDRPGVVNGERSVANVGKLMLLGSFAAPIIGQFPHLTFTPAIVRSANDMHRRALRVGNVDKLPLKWGN